MLSTPAAFDQAWLSPCIVIACAHFNKPFTKNPALFRPCFLQARNDLKLSVSHNLASKASKLGFTHDRKLNGKKTTIKVRRAGRTCVVFQQSVLPATIHTALLAVASRVAVAWLAAAAPTFLCQQNNVCTHLVTHCAAPLPLCCLSALQLNYLTKTKNVAGEVISALAANKKATVAFTEKQVSLASSCFRDPFVSLLSVCCLCR